MQDSGLEPEPKRTRRQRNPVLLFQNDTGIYHDANNRKKRTKKDYRSDIFDEKGEGGEHIKASIVTTFKWIGNGKHTGVDKVFYEKLEIKVGNHPALIQVGDDILLSSDDCEEEDVLDKTIFNRNIDGCTGEDDNEIVKVAMNDLKPFVGRVEAMWEEGVTNPTKSEGGEVAGYNDDRRPKMKFKVRWYFKKEDIEGLKGIFDGISRQNILEYMTPRELLLGEYSDENEVSTILGKCRVIRRNPGPLGKDGSGGSASSQNLKRDRNTGSFYCCFDISMKTVKGCKTKVTIKPYNGPEDQDDEDLPPSKKSRIQISQNGNSTTIASQGTESAGGISVEEGPSSTSKHNYDLDNSQDDVDDDNSLDEIMKGPPPTKPPTTEGSATQKIVIGENHQATIPELSTISSRREHPSVLVWKPCVFQDSDLEKFLRDAGKILNAYMSKEGIDVTRMVPRSLDPGHLKSQFKCREFDMDEILKLIHDQSYNHAAALQKIKGNPEQYLTLWTKEDKELYNSGFRRHFSVLRMISKGMGETGKDHKQVVDYHYRFKIPDQFKRYQDKKREQARRMLSCVEKHRLEEYLSSDTVQSVNNSERGGKKSHSWSRTGGGAPGSIGATESRRIAAQDFLASAKETVGLEKYLILVKHLKGLHARLLTIPQCREGFASVLEKYPQLMERFDEYLPKKFRG